MNFTSGKKIDEWLPQTELLDTFQSDCITMSEMLRWSGIKKDTPVDLVSIDIEVMISTSPSIFEL